MSAEQRLLIAVLVLANVVLYGIVYFSVQVISLQQAAAPQPTAIAVAEIPAFTPTSEPTKTPEPTQTATPEPSPTPTESPIATSTLISSTTGITATVTLTATASVTATSRAGQLANVSQTRSTTPIIRTPTRPRPTATAIPTPTPSGPLQPSDAWRTLEANSSAWYKIGVGGYHIEAILEAHPLDGMQLQVFAPNLFDKPIGLGTQSRGIDGLVWAGGRWEQWGDWMARVINNNPMAVQYRLLVRSNEIPSCEVIGYWEMLGGKDVYWKRCK